MVNVWDLEIRVHRNPEFKAGRPMSYESMLCRLAGWWTMGTSSLTPVEVLTLTLEPIA